MIGACQHSAGADIHSDTDTDLQHLGPPAVRCRYAGKLIRSLSVESYGIFVSPVAVPTANAEVQDQFQIIYKSLFAENTVASKEKKAQQRKHKYNSNKVHDNS